MAFNPVSIIFIWGELGKRLMGADVRKSKNPSSGAVVPALLERGRDDHRKQGAQKIPDRFDVREPHAGMRISPFAHENGDVVPGQRPESVNFNSRLLNRTSCSVIFLSFLGSGAARRL